MRKKTARLAAGMLVLAAVFFLYALATPQAGFPWGNAVIYTLYGAYLWVMRLLFAAPFKRGRGSPRRCRPLPCGAACDFARRRGGGCVFP